MLDFTLITGASSGIGLELARQAAQHGRNLLLVAREQEALLKARKMLLEEYPNSEIRILAVDLTTNQAAQKVIDFCKSHKLIISELINNAGFGDFGDFSKSDISMQSNIIKLNVQALTELTHLLLPSMIAARRGKIMNVGSIASFLPGPRMSVYFATKAYVLSFSRALAEELHGTGITVTCVCPGPTKTNFGSTAKVSSKNAIATTKVTAADVARYGWQAMQNGKVVAIHGMRNKIIAQVSKFIPRNLLVRIVKNQQH